MGNRIVGYFGDALAIVTSSSTICIRTISAKSPMRWR
jgi:hypothetical protein